MHPLIREITKKQEKDNITDFKVGDGVHVHTKIREGDKERIQVFAGIVIAIKGTGIQKTFTVRRVKGSIGVERIFPVHSPNIEKIIVDRESVRKRARMYYMRDRIGKRANLVDEKRLQNG